MTTNQPLERIAAKANETLETDLAAARLDAAEWKSMVEATARGAEVAEQERDAIRAQLSASRAAVARLTADRERLTNERENWRMSSVNRELSAEVARAEAKTAAEYEAHRMTRCERDALCAEVERLKAENVTFRNAQLGCEACDETIMTESLRELRSDKARLDWLLKRGLCFRGADKFDPNWKIGNETEWLYESQDARDVIDDAIKGDK